jgi:hypothetical protein
MFYFKYNTNKKDKIKLDVEDSKECIVYMLDKRNNHQILVS